ncbi:hypothetical protein C2845_PM11G03640 [Panicum miliaceum]|uniref:RNase H type-1 domain-containing protein n=1 Tax=Panicum miliaceum TaxID=4540 RepID=A0A3L6RN83_PANMI|nr:hypothetical protein C2845_PM11G03640 [Panicum miliaceum]
MQHLMVETDSETLVKALQTDVLDRSQGGVLFREANFLMATMFTSVTVVHVHRSCNSVAHELARIGRSRDLDHPAVWMTPLPEFVNVLLVRDSAEPRAITILHLCIFCGGAVSTSSTSGTRNESRLPSASCYRPSKEDNRKSYEVRWERNRGEIEWKPDGFTEVFPPQAVAEAWERRAAKRRDDTPNISSPQFSAGSAQKRPPQKCSTEIRWASGAGRLDPAYTGHGRRWSAGLTSARVRSW